MGLKGRAQEEKAAARACAIADVDHFCAGHHSRSDFGLRGDCGLRRQSAGTRSEIGRPPRSHCAVSACSNPPKISYRGLDGGLRGLHLAVVDDGSIFCLLHSLYPDAIVETRLLEPLVDCCFQIPQRGFLPRRHAAAHVFASPAAAAPRTALRRRSFVTRNLHHRRRLEQVPLVLLALLHCKPSRVLAAHRVPRRRSYGSRTHPTNAGESLRGLSLAPSFSSSFMLTRASIFGRAAI